MLFKDEHDFSLLPKIVFMTTISGACLLAGYLMFVDVNNMISCLKPYALNGNLTRQLIRTFFLLVLYFSIIHHRICFSET